MEAPGAETTATFRSKALLLCVRALRGQAGARNFVAAIGAGHIFEDETKPISRQLWLRALAEFETMVGTEGFRRLPRYLVHPKNLGFWSRLLRGAADPDAVYDKLDVTGDDVDPSWTWRTRYHTPHRWSAEICFAESDSLEDRRRIERALEAEMRAVPLLFGLDLAQVTSQLDDGDEGPPPQVVQTARWASATRPTVVVGTMASLLALVTTTSLVAQFGPPGWTRWVAGALAFGICASMTYVVARDVAYRAASRAQQVRILALEREGVLQRMQVQAISSPQDEPVIAGRYRLEEQLGVGAAGSVWRANRLTDGQLVAVKLLRTALAQDPRATDRLRREAQALGLSWHPHVVQVLDDGILPSGVAFLVTELLTGETLSARIQTHGPLSLAEVAQWGLQGVDALVAIHSAGVVHRDVKPDNLFLHCASPGQPRLKLIDFGIASVSWAETRLTRHGARVGTPGYASPEQEDGQQVDPRTDLYALGQCLKEAISGQAPASGEAGINWVLSGLPEQWTHVLFKLTARDREQRYADSREARAALSELVKLEEQFSVPRFWKGPLPSQSA